MTDIKKAPQKKKTILILGVSSFVGSNLAEFFKDDYKVVGTFNKNPVTIPGVLTFKCDVLQKDQIQLALFAFKPDVTIYAVGLTSIAKCALDNDLAEALNTSGLFNAVEYCQRYKSQIIYLSSSFVFSGSDEKSYMEMDIPDANTAYGKTQASSEFFIQKTSLNYLIFRCCKLYGRGMVSDRRNWFEVIEQLTHSGSEINCDDSVLTGHIDVAYLGMIIKIALDKESKNRLFQISSEDTMSIHDFTKLYAKTFSGNENNLSRKKWAFPVSYGSTSGESGKYIYKMDVLNVQGYMNISMPTVEESLEFTFKRLNGVKLKNNRSKDEGVEIKYI